MNLKLKKDFITQMIDGEQMMVPVGEAANQFHGIVKSNKTAAFIVDGLKEGSTEKGIVDALLENYDVSEDIAARDVRRILDTLRSIGALEEL